MAQSLNLDRRKNTHGEGQSSPKNFRRPDSKNLGGSRIAAVLLACSTVLLIPLRSYNPSHSRSASQDIFSSVCFPTVSRHVSSMTINTSRSNFAKKLAEQLPPSSLPPERLSGSSCPRLCHFGLRFLYIGVRAPWDSQSRQISRPDPGFRRDWRVHFVWDLGLSRRRCVGIQKLHASSYHSKSCDKCDDTYMS